MLIKHLFRKKDHMALKYFIGYNDNAIKPLYIKVPQLIWYAKYFNCSETMSFKASKKKLLEKYTKIWERISSLMNIKFDSEAV